VCKIVITLYLLGTVYSCDKYNLERTNPRDEKAENYSPKVPTVVTNAVTNISSTSATLGGTVSSDGYLSVTARGISYGLSQNPVITGFKVPSGSGTGNFSCNLTGLTSGTTYYARAYATNSKGTAYGSNVIFITTTPCNSFQVTHTAGTVAPVTKTVTYGTVETNLSGAIKCWITQNLGADNQASSATDATEAAAGWYWQFNRKQGYKHDGTTRTPAITWITSIDEASSWTAADDPCTILLGTGWRIPTQTEWTNADNNQVWNSYIGTYSSVLKIHAAGYLTSNSGGLIPRGSDGIYWSSMQYSNTFGWYLTFSTSHSGMAADNKAFGFSVRCLRD
jgi:uncharacterized protein (TIGR02145 family)